MGLRFRYRLWYCSLWTFGALAAFVLKADLVPQRSVLSLVEENDAFVGRDEHYTQGAQLMYLEAEDRLPRCLTNFSTTLPAWGFSESLGRVGIGIGQKLSTPKNLALSTAQPTDRPYAGWLYLATVLQRRGPGWWNLPMLESLQLDAGVIGPAALGERAQSLAHVDLGLGGAPQGWDTQLPNEPAFELKYARLLRWKIFTDGNLAAEMLPGAGFSLGNVNTSFRAGGTFRFGWRLPEDFGPPLLDSLVTASGGRPRDGEDHDGFYLFGGVVGRAIAYNAFLDGTAFRASQLIDKENLVGDFFAGLVISLRYVDGGMTWVTRTREYSGQPVWDTFASVFIRGRF